MGLMDLFRKKKEDSEDEGVVIEDPEPSYEVIEEYPVQEPFSSVQIVESEELGEGLHYFALEDPLEPDEWRSYRRMIGILSKELEPPTEEGIEPGDYVFEQAERIAERYYRSLGRFAPEGWERIFYSVVRDLAGYGPLHVMMRDPNIEDISCNGLNTPVYVWHRKYESIPSNISFTSAQVLNDFIVKMAHKSGKHISSAQPLLDGMLPEKHRLAATFMNEVSTKGSTFCIRKYREDPFSIVDLIELGTLNERIAAYFWLLLEYKMSFMIVGGTGAGKTSTLNALLSLMSGNDKVVTVEEVPELRTPTSNWTQLNTRESFQFGPEAPKSITIFDLVKVCLRYRPDYIIVGEVRGEEAYTLFQALATGHGGLCTMHADSLDRVIKRLTSPPMNVAEVYIPLMNSALHVQRVELPEKREGLSFGRRVRTVWEIEDFGKYREVASWDPSKDVFHTKFDNSLLLDRIARSRGMTLQQILLELDAREEFIRDIVKSGVRDQRKVTSKILSYYIEQRGKAATHPKVAKARPKKAEKKDEAPTPEEEAEEVPTAPEPSEEDDGTITKEEVWKDGRPRMVTRKGNKLVSWRYAADAENEPGQEEEPLSSFSPVPALGPSLPPEPGEPEQAEPAKDESDEPDTTTKIEVWSDGKARLVTRRGNRLVTWSYASDAESEPSGAADEETIPGLVVEPEPVQGGGL